MPHPAELVGAKEKSFVNCFLGGVALRNKLCARTAGDCRRPRQDVTSSVKFHYDFRSFKLGALSEDQFDGLLVEVLSLDGPHVFSAATLIEDLPNLDSLRFMKLVSSIEAAMGVALSAEHLMDVETVGDLRDLLSGAAG